MTATDKLRRMLDERGVEWGANDTYRLLVTSCHDASGHSWAFMEHKDGSFSKLTAYRLTPEQAVAAALGTIRLAGHKDKDTLPFPGFETYLQDNELGKLDDLDFYYLLMHLDETRQEIRLELSMPVLDVKGTNLGWQNRIILPPISISNEPLVDTKSVPAPNIEVVRKAS